MKTWSECRWYHYLAAIALTLLPSAAAAYVGFLINNADMSSDGKAGSYLGLILVWVFSQLVCGCFIWARVYSSSQSFYHDKLAVVDKKTGEVVIAGLGEVWLKPRPFASRLEVYNYRDTFSFQSSFSPVTSNPKVLPLEVRVTAKMDVTPGRDFTGFVANRNQREASITAFRSRVFDLIQHQLPQSLADRLNPFDAESVREFEEFVNHRLELSPGQSVYQVEIFLNHTAG